MIIPESLEKKIKFIALYYSFKNDPCDPIIALRIALNNEIERISKIETNNNQNRQ